MSPTDELDELDQYRREEKVEDVSNPIRNSSVRDAAEVKVSPYFRRTYMNCLGKVELTEVRGSDGRDGWDFK